MISCIRPTSNLAKPPGSITKIRPVKTIGKIGSYEVIKILGKGADGDVVLVRDSDMVVYAMKLSKVGKEINLSHEIEIYKHLQTCEHHENLINMLETSR